MSDAVLHYPSGIPVRNLWLLMLYASPLVRYDGWGRYALETDSEAIPDLVAELLVQRLQQRLKRPLNTQPQPQQASLQRLRGRVQMLPTLRQQAQQRGQVVCEFTPLQPHHTPYCYVRAALESMVDLVTRPSLRRQCQQLIAQLKQRGVTGTKPDRWRMRQASTARHEYAERILLTLADLAFDLRLPSEQAGEHHLLSAEREDLAWLRHLYEKAVAGFYQVVLPEQGWRVSAGKRLYWPVQQPSAGLKTFLPQMQSDIILEQPQQAKRIVIDTKFTHILKPNRFHAQRFSSPHLYQLYTYLMSQSGQGDPLADHASGLLLHPAVEQSYHEQMTVQQHCIRFATVDLAASSASIRAQLLDSLQGL